VIDFASDKSLVVIDDDDAYTHALFFLSFFFFSFHFSLPKRGIKTKSSFSKSAY
jgi:hypothetical protein